MPIELSTNLDYLIDSLRLHLGDTNIDSYRYIDSWLRTALTLAVKNLQTWWNHKYLIDTDDNVYRNIHTIFLTGAPPIIQTCDERPIVLAASLIIKGGSLESNSWNVGSWKDNEIAHSNIEGSKAKIISYQRDWDELTSLLKPPTSKLAWIIKGGLPGFQNNQYEVN